LSTRVAIVAARDGGCFRRLQRRAVLAPEVELVARAERHPHVVLRIEAGVDERFAVAERRGFRRLRARSVAVEVDRRQKCGAGDARLRVGLNDARYGGGDVEIGGSHLLDDFGELMRAETVPPIERRKPRFGRFRLARTEVVFFGDVDGRVGFVETQQATAERLGDEESEKHGHERPAKPFRSRPARIYPPTHTDNPTT
jgi:hypothetical protein